MANSELVYMDKWGQIIDYAEGYVEIRWFDSTKDMTGSDFNTFLSKFADVVEARKRPGCLVDSTNFRMDFNLMEMGWRDKHIIPRYNAAKVKRFAFHMPEGMPAIGKPPEKEGPGEFPTGYFGTRNDAISWLKE